ncbi:hypothetical protein HMPREF9446_01412 [Bacteroides fluxus YIT 12057]|uniref:Uncharacterized protein n=1 Tax=Bacteroides fluxus YIT 12057 TaxID=763034 RepID=F3PRR0_9BACE|nr:hypothetical protein HMPREF9446_01412 [Bacteroides fluxus YIT 12057]
MILPSEIYTIAKGETVIANILAQLNFIYPSLLFQLPPKQKESIDDCL